MADVKKTVNDQQNEKIAKLTTENDEEDEDDEEEQGLEGADSAGGEGKKKKKRNRKKKPAAAAAAGDALNGQPTGDTIKSGPTATLKVLSAGAIVKPAAEIRGLASQGSSEFALPKEQSYLLRKPINEILKNGKLTPEVTSSAKSDDMDLKNNDAVSDLEQAWEEALVKAPEVIALLGQITVLSGSTDFSLTNNTPVNGFQYMRHPQSFRATLTQVSNDGWRAFQLAHRNMKVIQRNMQAIPEQLKLLLQIIVQSPIKLVRKLATISLTNIRDMGQQCVELSRDTEESFENFIGLLREVLETTQVKMGTSETTRNETEREQTDISDRINSAKDLQSLKLREVSNCDEDVEKYYVAMDLAPKYPGQFPPGELRTRQRKAQLCEKIAKESTEEMIENSKTLNQLMMRLGSLGYEKRDLNQTIAAMKEGIKYLSKIQEGWSSVALFFMNVAVDSAILINATNINLVKFVEVAVEKADTPGDDGSWRPFISQLLAEHTPNILKGAYLIHTLSSTCMDVSNRSILDRLKGISGLSILEPIERQAAVTALLESSKEASAQIRKITRTRREQYNATVNAIIAEETKSFTVR